MILTSRAMLVAVVMGSLVLGCGSKETPRSRPGGQGGDDQTGGTGGTGGGGSGGTGGRGGMGGTGGGGTGGGGSGGGGAGGSVARDAGADATVDAEPEPDAAVEPDAAPDVAPDTAPVVYELPRAPWQGRDIGPLGTQKGGVFLNTSANGGQNYDLISSGATGIGGTSDSFFFMYQPMAGPGVVLTRLQQLAMAGMNGAGGLMIRESLEADAAMVFIGAYGGTAGGRVIVRRARGEAAVSLPMEGTLPSLKPDNAVMFRLVRTGSTIRVYAGNPNIIETDAALVGGGMVELTLAAPNGPMYYGAVATSGDVMNPTRARFNELAIHNLGNNTVTQEWSHHAIGTAGSSAVWTGAGVNARLTLSSNGQPWGAVMGTSRDFLGFAYFRNNESTSLRFLVNSQTLSDANSRVSAMIRDVSSLNRTATTVALSLTQGVGLELEYRDGNGAGDELTKVATRGAIIAPLWLRLDRSVVPRPNDPLGTSDTWVTAYYTTDNNGTPRQPWTLIGNSLPFPSPNNNPPGLGIALGSYSPTAIHQAEVSRISITAAPPPPDGGILPDASPEAGAPDAAEDAGADAGVSDAAVDASGG